MASPWLPLQTVSGILSQVGPILRPPATGSLPEPPGAMPPSAGMSAIPTPRPLPGPALVPPAVPASPQFLTLIQAAGLVSFKIRVPSWLPKGYELKGIAAPPVPPELPTVRPPAPNAKPGAGSQSVPSVLNPPAPAVAPGAGKSVILVFTNASGDTFILSEAEAPKVPAPRTFELPASPGSTQDVTINGQPGQYVEGLWTAKGWVKTGNHLVHWQSADGIVLDLNSRTLDRETLLLIANSIT